MKKVVILAFCVSICISSIIADETPVEKKNHISLSIGVFMSEIAYSRDMGRFEVGEVEGHCPEDNSGKDGIVF